MWEPDPNNNNSLTLDTVYSFNVLDLLTLVSQGVQTRGYLYDDLGRLTQQTTPEGGTWNYQYNAFNLVTLRTDARGVDTAYTYDTLNRLTQVSYDVSGTSVPATAPVSYTYGTDPVQNNNGRLVTVTDGVGSETYNYDQLGRVTQFQKVISGTTYTTNYAYNLAGELTSITYPSGRVLQQTYDPIGRLTSIASGTTTYVNQFNYNVAWQVTAFSYGNGVNTSFGYSADRLQLTSLSYIKGAQNLLSLGYGYGSAGGNNGQILSITDSTGTQEAGRSVTYTYDTLHRLKSAVTQGSVGFPKWGLSWSYDRYGNRLSQTQTYDAPPMNSLSFANPGGAQMNRPDGFGFDANGNLTSEPPPVPYTYQYDAENRQVSMTTGGTTANYSYDGNGLRVKKQTGTSGPYTVYIFSGTKVVAEYDNGAAPTAPTREYIYSGSVLVAKIEGSATNYFHQDHLSNRVVTDSTGTVAEQKGHYPFGESWYEGATPNKLKFTSYEREAESGNDYAIFRTYVNRLGRFKRPDPIAGALADPQSLNRYAYVRNDPANLVDPLGLYFEWIDGCLYQISAGEDDRTIYTLISCGVSEGLGWRHLFITLAMADDFRNGPLDRGRGPGGEPPKKKDPPGPTKSPCGPQTTGFGAGIISASGTLAAGAGAAGTAATGSAGGGVFYNSSSGPSLGALASGGATAYAGSHVAGVPRQQGPPTVVGAFAGGGSGYFITNAGSAQQLRGPFTTISADIGTPFLGKASIQIASSTNGVWMFSLTIGPGAGASFSLLTTNTVAAGTGCP